MLKRTIAISLVLLCSVGILLPFADSNAHGVRQTSQVGQRRHHRYRSRAWWRRYRTRLRKKRAAAAAELAHRNGLLTLPANLNLGNFTVVTPADVPAATTPTSNVPPAAATRARLVGTARPRATAVATVVSPSASGPVLVNTPVVVNAPATQKATVEARPVTEAMLRPKNPVTPLPGQLSISVVALSRPNPAFLTAREEAKLLSGVAVADLRRIVIDRMVTAGGWVTNDYVREINGGRVFVVTAKTPRDGQTPEKAWTFYFTESGGRIYSLTTDSPVEHLNRMTREAERFIGTLRSTIDEK